MNVVDLSGPRIRCVCDGNAEDQGRVFMQCDLAEVATLLLQLIVHLQGHHLTPVATGNHVVASGRDAPSLASSMVHVSPQDTIVTCNVQTTTSQTSSDHLLGAQVRRDRDEAGPHGLGEQTHSSSSTRLAHDRAVDWPCAVCKAKMLRKCVVGGTRLGLVKIKVGPPVLGTEASQRTSYT